MAEINKIAAALDELFDRIEALEQKLEVLKENVLTLMQESPGRTVMEQQLVNILTWIEKHDK